MLLQPLRNVQRGLTVIQRVVSSVVGAGQIRIPIVWVELGEPCRLDQLLPGPIIGPLRLFSVMGREIVHYIYRPLALIEGDPRRLQESHIEAQIISDDQPGTVDYFLDLLPDLIERRSIADIYGPDSVDLLSLVPMLMMGGP